MPTKETAINKDAKIIQHLLRADGTFPNSVLPVLVYKNMIDFGTGGHPTIAEHILESNNWKNSWRNGIYNYHHYHSITHEVLVVYSGKCHLQLGGDDGILLEINKGDVIVIPAGVAHKNAGSTEDFKCVGAYPNGLDFDINLGKAGERPAADNNIANVQTPSADPILGKHGPLLQYWAKHHTI